MVTRAQSTKHKGPRETLKRAEKQNDRNGTTKKKQTRHREGKRGSSTGATRNGVPELQKALPPCTKSTQGGAETRDHAKRQDTTRAKLVLVACRELTRERPPVRPVLGIAIPTSAQRRTSLSEGEDILPEEVNNCTAVAYVGPAAGCVHGVGGKQERVREPVMPPSHMP